MKSAIHAERQNDRVTDAGGTGVVLRFAVFYGADATHTIDYVKLARRGMAPVVGRPESYVSHVHLDDAASAAVAALDLAAGAYNVVEDDPVTKQELSDVAARSAGRDDLSFVAAKVSRLGGKKTEPLRRSHRIANQKIRSSCSWRPTYESIRDGWPVVASKIEQETSRA
jgi:nucleoside-diphosphate-sugar epimerase